MPKYAATTEVTSDRSRAEIERTLTRYGASRFAYAWGDGKAMVQFEMRDRRIRFLLPLPALDSDLVRRTPKGRLRNLHQTQTQYEQETRQRWRALLLSIKAKLESVDSGIEQFEEAFLAQIVLPDNSTVGDWMQGQVQSAYENGTMPSMLPGMKPQLAAPKTSDN
jgi:hypothetical protein